MRTLIIDRKKWLRGEGAHDSRLLRDRDGKMCCLGFDCLACGLSPEEINEHETPATVAQNKHNCGQAIKIDHLVVQNFSKFTMPDAVVTLMRLNDDSYLSETDRENLIREGFHSLDVNVEFIG